MTDDLLTTIARLRESFAVNTSQLPDQWSRDRPSTGHCAVVSVILQAMYGGDIVRGETSAGVIHYWNVIDGVTVDATRDQFNPRETISVLAVNPPTDLYLFRDTAEKVVMLLGRALSS